VNTLADDERPVSEAAVARGAADIKWRFFWRIGPRPDPSATRFPQLNAAQVIPEKFKLEWAGVLDSFGNKLMSAVHTTAQMLALGLGLEKDSISDKMIAAPHLLAPTGMDLSTYGQGAANEKSGDVDIENIVAGVHYDLNLLTIHGRAAYPGLWIWTNAGKRLSVSVPPGALLIQAGAQIEHLTGGAIRRGFHEVVVDSSTIAALRRARAERASLWRVSSTLFAHVQSDQSLRPLGRFASECSPERLTQYDVLAGEQVDAELKALALSSDGP
jgi:isopenicillin N synthase-like dioxygenase